MVRLRHTLLCVLCTGNLIHIYISTCALFAQVMCLCVLFIMCNSDLDKNFATLFPKRALRVLRSSCDVCWCAGAWMKPAKLRRSALVSFLQAQQI